MICFRFAVSGAQKVKVNDYNKKLAESQLNQVLENRIKVLEFCFHISVRTLYQDTLKLQKDVDG